MPTHYEILGVSRNASLREIKRAYRKLAMKWHPDRNQSDGSKLKFQEINKAYSILSDCTKREAYDLGILDIGNFSNINPFDIFNQFFNSSSQSVFNQKVLDIDYKIKVTLEQICQNKRLRIKYPRRVRCKQCKGDRTGEISKKSTCYSCEGSGIVRHQINLGGFFPVAQSTECKKCLGTGEYIPKRFLCVDCEGRGTEKVEGIVVVECSMFNHDRPVIFRKKGHYSSMNKSHGNLNLKANLAKHSKFRKKGWDLHTVVEISPLQSFSGVHGEIAHPNGETLNFSTEKNGKIILNDSSCLLPKQGILGKGDMKVFLKIKDMKKIPVEVIIEVTKIFEKYELVNNPKDTKDRLIAIL